MTVISCPANTSLHRLPASLVARGETLYDAEIDKQRVRVVESRVAQPAAGNGPDAIVRIAETKHKRDELAREILLSVVLPQVVLILIAGAIVWFGVVRGLAPLERIEQAIAQRSHRDRRPLEVGTVPGEVKPLMTEINALLERIDSILTLQNRFIADAAHQLKTPVAAVQAQLELAMRDDDPVRVRASLGTVHTGLQRLARIVSQLLALARNEPEAVNNITMRPVDLNALVFECAGEWVHEALKRRIDLGFEGTEAPVMVKGDAARLRELLDNLVDNAVRYSNEGGHVTVRVSAQPQPTVSVSDDGPGIPAEEQTLIFERFHRRLGTSVEGSGLGLAIAQEIAYVHGGEICLYEDADGVGNTFALSLPLPDTGASHAAGTPPCKLPFIQTSGSRQPGVSLESFCIQPRFSLRSAACHRAFVCSAVPLDSRAGLPNRGLTWKCLRALFSGWRSLRS